MWHGSTPVSILHKSIEGCYRPVRVADGPITARCRFMRNASWVGVRTVIIIAVASSVLGLQCLHFKFNTKLTCFCLNMENMESMLYYIEGMLCYALACNRDIVLIWLYKWIQEFTSHICVSLWCFTDEVEDPYVHRTYVCSLELHQNEEWGFAWAKVIYASPP